MAMEEPQPLRPPRGPSDALLPLAAGGTEDVGKDHPAFASWSENKGLPRTVGSELEGEPLNILRVS